MVILDNFPKKAVSYCEDDQIFSSAEKQNA